MENCTVIIGDELREESSARIRKFRMKRKRFMKREDFESGSLPLRAPSSEEACKQESSAKPHCHTVFKSLNPSLLAIVAIKYQDISQDKFKTLALNIWSFLIAIFIYSLILFAMKQSRYHHNVNLQIILRRVALASVVVSSFSLLSLLLPDCNGLKVLFISWALFVVISASPLLHRAYNWLLTGKTTVINFLICFARNLFTGSNIGQQQPPPQGTRPPL